jgi:hypothetical protein
MVRRAVFGALMGVTMLAVPMAQAAPNGGGDVAEVDATWECDGTVTVTSEHRALSNIVVHHDGGETRIELDGEVFEHELDAADYPGLWAVDVKAGNNGARGRGERVALEEPDCEPVVRTGVIQVKLSWDTEADLDLWVTEPNGNVIYYFNGGPSSTGGELDRDDNFPCGTATDFLGGVENIVWPDGTTPDAGEYLVRVRRGASCVPEGTVTTYLAEVFVDGVLVTSTGGTTTAPDPMDIASISFQYTG